MGKVTRKIDIFISSPSDVSEERQIVVKTVKELNELEHIRQKFQLDTQAYESETPGVVGEAPQHIVDRYMMKAEEADIFVCILWGRMGTPVVDPESKEGYESGTHYEFLHAYQSYQIYKKPVILLYRCMRPINPANALEAAKVVSFFSQFQGPEAKFKGLFKTYQTIEEFSSLARRDIDHILSSLTSLDRSDSAQEHLNDKPYRIQVQSYLSLLIEQFQAVRFYFTLPVAVGERLLTETPIVPRLTAPSTLPIRLPASRSTEEPVETLISWEELVAARAHTVITGELGSGKTFLSLMICLNLANRALKSGGDLIPIYVPLYEMELHRQQQQYSAPQIPRPSPILSFLESHYASARTGVFPISFWRWLLENYATLIVFDGLDEIEPSSLRANLVDWIKQLKSEYPQARTIVTLRPEAYQASLYSYDYLLSRVLPLSTEQQLNLISWLRQIIEPQVLDVKSLDEQSKQFTELTHIPILRTRLNLPLFLSAAYLNFALAEDALKSKEFLIETKLVELALNEWDVIKRRVAEMHIGEYGMSRPISEGTSENMDLLNFMGWHLHSQRKDEIAVDEVVEWFSKTYPNQVPRPARNTVEPKVHRIANRSNILTVSPQKLSFQYELDQLYFAARNFVGSTKMWIDLLPFLGDSLGHKLTFAVFDLLILEDISAANDLLEFILKYADQRTIQQQAELTTVVAQCLLRIEEPAPPVKEQVVKRILAILEDKQQRTNLHTRIELADVMGYLGDPRIGSNMVLVPRGTFRMGFAIFPEDRPVHRVIVDDFYIDKYPVTNAQFHVFIEDNGYEKPEFWTPEGWAWIQQSNRKCPKYWHSHAYNKLNYPVVGVSWYEAAAYAKWAGKRLPIEREWEKAARGDTGWGWSWGPEFRSDYLNSAEGRKALGGPTPIGIYPAGVSPYGIFDMCGNVSEWTQDWYQPYEKSTHKDSHFGESYKVRRGGSWDADQDFVRCTCRIPSLPTSDYAVVGFRCCASMRP